MGSRVIDSDLELFLTGFIRTELGKIDTPLAQGVFVSNRFPSPSRPKTVVVRDDGGQSTSIITSQPSIGVTVMAGDDVTQGQLATDLAHLVKMIINSCARPDPGNPVAAVVQSYGPYKILDDSSQPSRYMTFTLSVVGQPFD
ncbi:MAG: hypothetical protein HIU81_03925 [Acidobacteria bacterium]|nr:hypothetical protein [Acidobacteriota bacterium]